MKIKRKKTAEKILDEAHSLYVRKRDNYECIIHKRAHELNIALPFKCAGVMQCNHKFSRGKKSIRYHEKNSICGCSGANMWAHFHEAEWIELCYQLWNDDMRELEVISKMICKRTKVDKLNLANYFRDKVKQLGDKQ